MCSEQEINALTEFCRNHLPLEGAVLPDEAFYQSLPFCIIDAVYSINAKYASTRLVVERYRDYFNLQRIRHDRNILPLQTTQESVNELIQHYDELGIDRMTDDVFWNRQRTSTRSGILKSEAVLRFAKVLQRHNVNYFQDVASVIGNHSFADSIQFIPGQTSGTSLRYFFMLSGAENFVKPDRMIMRFIRNVINREMNIYEAENCLRSVCERLKASFPNLTPRLLAHIIHKFFVHKVFCGFVVDRKHQKINAGQFLSAITL